MKPLDRYLELQEFHKALTELTPLIGEEQRNFANINSDLIDRLNNLADEVKYDLDHWEESDLRPKTLDDFHMGDDVIYKGKLYIVLTKKNGKLRIFNDTTASIVVEVSEVVKYEG